MIIETIAIGALTTVIGSISGYLFGIKKREQSEKERRTNELIRCPALVDMIHKKNDYSYKARCEFDCGHIGPHKHTVEKNYSNAGQIIWWNDEEKAPEKKALKRVK